MEKSLETKKEEDAVSYCGSFSGETFSRRRKARKTCLFSDDFEEKTNGSDKAEGLVVKIVDGSTINWQDPQVKCQHGQTDGVKMVRFNRNFHYFRFLVITFAGLTFGLMMILRYNITVAMIRMVNQTALYLEEHPNRTVEDFENEGFATGGEFDWNNEIQQMLMSGYMIAYTLPQLPVTKLSLRFGVTRSMFISLGLISLSTILMPPFSYMGWQWALALRLINGLGSSGLLPFVLYLIENWMPYDQMSLGLTLAQAIQASCCAIQPLLVGMLTEVHWSLAFYVPGFVTLVFSIVLLILISDKPEKNRFVSEQELARICGCVNSDGSEKKVANKAKVEQAENSWTDVLRLPAFYAYIFIWIFYCSTYSGFVFVLPTYLRQFLKISVSLNGTYNFIIQSGGIIAMLWPHSVLSLLQSKRIGLSPTASRRVSYIASCGVTALTYISVGLLHQFQLPLLFVARCFHSSNDVIVTGNLMNNFAEAGLSSIAFSMVNTVGNLSVTFASTFIGYILDRTGQSEEAWSYIYYALGAVQLLMCLTFCCLIDSKPIEIRKKAKNKLAHQEQNSKQ